MHRALYRMHLADEDCELTCWSKLGVRNHADMDLGGLWFLILKKNSAKALMYQHILDAHDISTLAVRTTTCESI